MARSIPANPSAGLLAWAREDAGLTVEDVASRLNVSPDRLARWEEGQEPTTMAKLRTMADVYRRPLATFFLPAPPESRPQPADFRTLVGEERDISPALRKAIGRAQGRHYSALELAEELGEQPPRLPTLSEDAIKHPEKAAEEIRGWLDVPIEEQRGWRDEYDALWGWIGAVERIGPLVMFIPGIKLTEFRGFSLGHSVFPVIAINSKESPRPRVFTLLHELAHLGLRQGGICDEHGSEDTRDIEVKCNAIAASILMPRNRFVLEPEVAFADEGEEDWEDADLEALARRFTTSREAVLRRILEVGKTTQDYYQHRRRQWQRQAQAEGDRDGFAPYPVKRLGELGTTYAKMAYTAHREGAISTFELSRFLNVKMRHIDPIGRALQGRLR